MRNTITLRHEAVVRGNDVFTENSNAVDVNPGAWGTDRERRGQSSSPGTDSE